MSVEILENQLQAWKNKPALRNIYGQWFKAIKENLSDGISVEVGCGIGRLRTWIPNVLTIDIVRLAWTDVVCYALELPFRNESLGNLILFDVLHHLSHPVRFFREASRLLKPKGRIIIMEPYVSPVSWVVYRFFHPEPVIMGCDPYDSEGIKDSDKPFDSNQAIPTLMFYRSLKQWREMFPEFEIKIRKRLALFAYPATGGFGGRQLLPAKMIGWVNRMESLCKPLDSLFAFRTLIVVEKE